jgi:hypothetical protein
VIGVRLNRRNVPVEPDQAFGGCVLLLLELVENKLLEGLGEGGSGKLAVTDFLGHVSYGTAPPNLHAAYLDVARHVVLDRLECCGTQKICSMLVRTAIERH